MSDFTSLILCLMVSMREVQKFFNSDQNTVIMEEIQIQRSFTLLIHLPAS